MENEEIEQKLSNLEKKLDKVLRMTTLIAKSLYLVPISEKEERERQLLVRKNAAVIHKIQDEFAALEEKPKEDSKNTLNFGEMLEASEADVYSDVIGDDFIS